MEEETEFKMCNPTEYEIIMKAPGADKRLHYVVHNKENNKCALIYNKKDSDDASFYSPYLMHVVGKKVGINVPETELGIILHKDIDKYTYKDSFYESSLVYRDDIDAMPFFTSNLSHVSQDVVKATYFLENSGAHSREYEHHKGNAIPITLEEYVNSNIYYLTTRGRKPRQEYTKNEIDEMKQELIDRVMFGIKLGIHGTTNITLRDNKNARLDPYYLSSRNMFSFNVHNEWIEAELAETDEKFRENIEQEYKPQIGIPPNVLEPNSQDVLRYVFKKYPKQAEEAYKKLKQFTKDDLKSELESYSRLDENHKRFALRVFETREKDFDQVYEEYKKNKDQER